MNLSAPDIGQSSERPDEYRVPVRKLRNAANVFTASTHLAPRSLSVITHQFVISQWSVTCVCVTDHGPRLTSNEFINDSNTRFAWRHTEKKLILPRDRRRLPCSYSLHPRFAVRNTVAVHRVIESRAHWLQARTLPLQQVKVLRHPAAMTSDELKNTGLVQKFNLEVSAIAPSLSGRHHRVGRAPPDIL